MRYSDNVAAERAVELYYSNLSIDEIAENIGHCTSFVYSAWKKACLPKRMTKLQREVYKYHLQGLCSVEIAEIIGTKTKYVIQAAKAIGNPFTEEERDRSIKIAKSKAVDNQYGTEEERIQKQIDFFAEYHPKFEYISGWLASDGMMEIKCKSCGLILEKSAITIRRKNRNIQCPICEKQKEIEKHEKREADRKRIQELKKKYRVFNREFQQMAFKQCKCCGSLFIGRNSEYCSAKCSNKIVSSIKKDKRIKKKKAVIVDRDITLEKLFERDKGQCWLCGGLCDWNDYSLTQNGAFVVGKNYPSEDHVIPLSKGGLHSWNNVKLAHHYCNTIKSNKVVSL